MGSGAGGEEGTRVFEGKERIREMIDCLADAIRGGEGDEDVEAAIVCVGWRRRGRSHGCRVSPTIFDVSENRGRRRAGREGGWDGQRNQKEESEDRDRQRGRN